MNPLDRILSAGAANLQRDAAPEILKRAAAQGAKPAGLPGAAPANSAAAKAAEFARYFPGIAAGQSGAAGLAGRVSSGSLSQSANIQSEIAADPERKRLYNAALDFQGIFIGKMLKSMRGNLNPENDLLYGGNRQQIFEDMLYDEYSKSMSRSGGFDLADQMYLQLSAKLPPVGTAVAGTKANDPQAGRYSTAEIQRGAVGSDAGKAPDSAAGRRARQSYDEHSNRISTEQIWNENDWRP